MFRIGTDVHLLCCAAVIGTLNGELAWNGTVVVGRTTGGTTTGGTTASRVASASYAAAWALFCAVVDLRCAAAMSRQNWRSITRQP